MKKPFSQKNKSQELDKVSLFSPDFYAFFFVHSLKMPQWLGVIGETL